MNIVLFFLVAILALCVFLSLSDPHRATRAILRLLADGRWWYGLDLVEASNGILKRGAVYVWLMRLEEKGLVTHRQDPTPPPRPGLSPRRQYQITDAGRRARERLAASEGASGRFVLPV
jgi:DNA-binding PadR family transcriptional regulator